MGLLRFYPCPQCHRKFATHSNLKRHAENPNIHNMPFKRSRDQKRWKNHAKKQTSKEETAQRMRKWRAANRDKNKWNDLRCRVYRLARQKFRDDEYLEKEIFIKEQISRRLGRQRLLTNKHDVPDLLPSTSSVSSSSSSFSSASSPTTGSPEEYQPSNSWYHQEKLPFYNAPHHQIELPTIKTEGHCCYHHHPNKTDFQIVKLPPIKPSAWYVTQSLLKKPLLLQPNPITLPYTLPLKI